MDTVKPLTVAGSTYSLGSSAVASKISSLNGGGVGEVVTLLLGMDNEVADVITGEEADSVFYGVVQTATRSLVEDNGADVLQKISVMCTDGITRTVNVDKSLNYPAGWMVRIDVTPEGENVSAIGSKSVSGTVVIFKVGEPTIIVYNRIVGPFYGPAHVFHPAIGGVAHLGVRHAPHSGFGEVIGIVIFHPEPHPLAGRQEVQTFLHPLQADPGLGTKLRRASLRTSGCD